MIEGLRLLPRIQTQRDEVEDGWFYSCDDCDLFNDLDQKRIFRCGWIPESERITGMGTYPESTVCPGYTTTLPDVQETARALQWRRDGQLREAYDVPLTALLRTAIDVLDSAAKRHDREQIAQHKRESQQ